MYVLTFTCPTSNYIAFSTIHLFAFRTILKQAYYSPAAFLISSLVCSFKDFKIFTLLQFYALKTAKPHGKNKSNSFQIVDAPQHERRSFKKTISNGHLIRSQHSLETDSDIKV